MRIESITLHNFRQYRDVCLSFERKEGEKDLHIICGDNTAGKSNIMNAITWCLYGKEYHLRDDSRALFRLNTGLVQDIREQGGGKDFLKVTLAISTDDGRRVEFERTEHYNIKADSCRDFEQSFVIKEPTPNGDTNIVDEQTVTTALVKKYIPEEINEYIFFDGERLEGFFDKESIKKIRGGVHDLTQATMLEKAAKGFEGYIADDLEPKLKKCGNKDIQNLTTQLTAAKGTYKQQEAVVKTINDQVTLCEQEIATLDSIIGMHGQVGEKDRELKEVTDKIAAKEKELSENETRTMNFIRDYYPLIKLFPTVKAYYDYIIEETNKAASPVVVDREELKSILEKNRCSVCNQDLATEEAVKYVQGLLDQHVVSGGVMALLNQDLASIRQMAEKLEGYKQQKEALILESAQIRKEIADMEKVQQELQAYLNSVPDSEGIKESIEKRKEWKESRDSQLEKQGVEKAKLAELDGKVQEIQGKLDEAVRKAAGMATIQQQIDYCKSCAKTLRAIMNEILEESRQQLEAETFDTFSRLLSNGRKLGRVEIAKDFNFSLYDRFGNQCLGSNSAGEANILALAFTLTLQSVSGHDSSLFIDTPTGRIDSNNRLKIVDTLLSIADSKQIVLLFTPTEYTDEIRERFAGRYSTYRELSIDEETTHVSY